MNISEILIKNNTNLSKICENEYEKISEELKIYKNDFDNTHKHICELAALLTQYWGTQTVNCISHCQMCMHCLNIEKFGRYTRVNCGCGRVYGKPARILHITKYTKCIGMFHPVPGTNLKYR